MVWAGDIHCNSTAAVSPPNAEIDDGVPVGQNKIQSELWLAWLDAWKQVARMKRNVVLVLGGEICDIDGKNRGTQYLTKNPEKAQANAIELLRPALKVAQKVIVLRGTEAHVGESAWTDESIARCIHKQEGVEVLKNGREFSWWECDVYIGGKLFNLAHHVNMGNVPRTERNAANHLAADLMMSYARRRKPPPDYAMRGHVHRAAESSFNYPVRAIICPAWTVHASYIHRIGKGHSPVEIGLMIVDPAADDVRWKKYETKDKNPEFI